MFFSKKNKPTEPSYPFLDTDNWLNIERLKGWCDLKGTVKGVPLKLYKPVGRGYYILEIDFHSEDSTRENYIITEVSPDRIQKLAKNLSFIISR